MTKEEAVSVLARFWEDRFVPAGADAPGASWPPTDKVRAAALAGMSVEELHVLREAMIALVPAGPAYPQRIPVVEIEKVDAAAWRQNAERARTYRIDAELARRGVKP